ncbi:DNA-directed RNA polymerase II subunit RPB1-like isoform X2 [Gymnodraco acuticeps]|uniref:DNA-directed RNA polymerase II subunit RPB1-like isoform X1 n=1 Tax=Gymnodraco acuticeps TaxID=8218 RepID=A0A6P8W3U7_GYMAC|nr:DNA-directed RNA polymerase II subunit RPB1-like isoform X1 [Gymnodraco acuticeps]XP_034082317.1 DNA-directed RNA polymerase II subunit RPB1-like isoform X2 [Gymnodraco acuticeps]
MTCGVHLGIFLIVLVQAEHVRCLWASQAAQSKNNNTYVGFRQNNREAGVNYLQNRLRQAQSRNLNIPSAVGSRFSWGPSTGGYTQTVSQPAKSGLAKVRLVQGSSVSKPNLNRVPKQRFHGLSSAIVGSDSLSKSSNKDTQKSSSLFGAGAPEPNQTPARTKTSSSVRAKLVSKTNKPSRPSAPKNPSQTEVVNPYKSKLFSGNAGNARGSYKATSMASSYGTSLESNVGNGPIFKPHSYSTSYDSKSSREGTSGKKLAPTKTHIIPEQFGGYAIRRPKAPGQEKVSVRKPQQAYQTPIKAYVAPQRQATNQAYNAPQQQTLNRVYETSNKAYETPNRVYNAPNRAYNAPNRAHETPNRAHETPNRAHETPNRAHETPNRAHETPNRAHETPNRTPNRAYETPNRTPNRPYETPNRPYETPNRPYETPNRPYETPKKAYVAPQRQATNQAYKAPNRAYVAPQRQAEPQAYIFPQVAPLKSRVLT